MLTADEWLLVGIIAAALGGIAVGRLRPDLVAILVLLALAITKLISPEEALSGFSRSVVITIIGLFMITQALEDTGVVDWIARRVERVGGGSEVRLVILFMAAGSGLSLVMNNIAAGAVLLPAAVQVGRRANVPPSKLLMPLSFGTLTGGMATYFTTANIILSSILRDQGQPRLNMLDFLPTGGLIVIAGLAFMLLVGRHLLPKRDTPAAIPRPDVLSRRLYSLYQLNERLWHARVLEGSPLVGTPLHNSRIGQALGLTVIGIWRGHQLMLNPAPTEVIRLHDELLILGREERAAQMAEWQVQVTRANGEPGDHRDYSIELTEVIIPPRSGIVGKSLSDVQFRSKHHLTAVALWREGRSVRTDVGKMPLRVGDALLMMGGSSRVATLAEDRDFLVLQSGHSRRALAPHKAGWALGITAAVLLLSILEIVPTAEAMLMGAAATALTGCIDLDEAYRSIEWRVIFLIAGMLPLSTAMLETGLAARVGTALVDAVAPFGPLALVAGLFVLTMLITQVIGGQVAALIVGPIAVASALELKVNPQAVAVAVASACSAAFLTPIAHPVNVLMMGPGGYTFADFLKVGTGLTVVTFFALLLGMVIFWGL